MKRKIIAIVLCTLLSVSSSVSIGAAVPHDDNGHGGNPRIETSDIRQSCGADNLHTQTVDYPPEDVPFYYLATPVPLFKVTNGNTINATWNPIKDASGYAIFVYKGNSKDHSKIYYVKGKKNTKWSKKFPLGKTYRIQVSAYHDEHRGELQYGEPSPLDDGKIKTAPGNTAMSAVSRKKGTYTLNWLHAAGAERYQIWYSTSENGRYRLYKSIPDEESLTFTKAGVKSGRIFYFKVRAYRKQIDQKNIYGSFSEVKKVRVR